MPCIKVFTNVPKNKIADNFVDKIIPILAKALNKPEAHFICMLSSGVPVHLFGDSTRPGAIANIESIGSLSPEENINTARLVTDFIEKELGVEPKRFFISFYDLTPANVAVNGNTVAGASK